MLTCSCSRLSPLQTQPMLTCSCSRLSPPDPTYATVQQFPSLDGYSKLITLILINIPVFSPPQMVRMIFILQTTLFSNPCIHTSFYYTGGVTKHFQLAIYCVLSSMLIGRRHTFLAIVGFLSKHRICVCTGRVTQLVYNRPLPPCTFIASFVGHSNFFF